MNIINIDASSTEERTMPYLLGRQTETRVTQVVFDISSWVEAYGDGTAQVSVLRPTDDTPYLATVTREDDDVIWTILSADTAYSGIGQMQLVFTPTNTNYVKKTKTFKTRIDRSLLDDEGEFPDPTKSWLEQAYDVSTVMGDIRFDVEAGLNDTLSAKGEAISAKDTAVSAKDDAISAKNDSVSAKNDAVTAKNDAVSAKTASESAASDSEAYAVGKRGGVDVESSDAAYHNNSKYYAEQAASSASAIINTEVHEPIIADGTWRVYDRTEDEYVDTEVPATGPAPVIAGSKSGGTTTITADGTTIATILDGTDGQDGSTPVITASKSNGVTTVYVDGSSIATINDGEDGTDGSTPVITASKSNGVTTVYVDGSSIATINDGEDGSTPVISATKTEGVTTITADGVSIATINDGEKGDKGDTGEVSEAELQALLPHDTVTGSSLSIPDALPYPVDALTVKVTAEQTTTESRPWPITGKAKSVVSVNSDTFKYNLSALLDNELPAGFIRIASMSMNDNCYYEKQGFYLNGSDTMRFSLSITNACNIIGAYSGTGGLNYSLYGSESGNYLRYYSDTYNSSFIANKKYDVTLTPTGSHGMKSDSTWDEASFTTSRPFCIGTTSATISTTSKMRGTFYGNVEVEGPNGLRFKGIPCERLSDGTIGWYDTVAGNFLEPIGTNPTAGEYVYPMYGGTLNVLTGVLTVDRAIVDLGNLTWILLQAESSGYLWGTPSITSPDVDVIPVCTDYEGNSKAVNNLGAYNKGDGTCCFIQEGVITGSRFYVRDDAHLEDTAEEFKAAMSGVKVVYGLATPVTYQLTAHEVELLAGSNTLSADSGDVTVTYTADIKGYIDKKVAELQALILD